MLHAKFQDHRKSGSGEERFLKVFTIYGHGGHLGHETWTIYINFRSTYSKRLHFKFALIGQAVSEKMFENNGNVHVYSPGAGADNPLGSFFHKQYYLVNIVLCCKFSSIQ